jgi:long-chain acyl-CoA synthetase
LAELITVHGLLEGAAERHPDALALEHAGAASTYADLVSAARRIATALIDHGVGRGDRVGLLLDNGPAFVSGFFGILEAGACCVALNHANKTDATAALLQDSGAVALVTAAAHVRRDLPALLAGAPTVRTVLVDRAAPNWALPDSVGIIADADLDGVSDARPPALAGPDDRAAIIYTSGSTGRPRGVTLTHRNLVANTRQILDYLPIARDDSVLCVLPFHYSYGMSLLLTHTAVGGRVVVDNRFAFPASVVDHLEESRATSFAGVPSTYAILAARTDFLTRRWPDLRYVTQAGGAMSPVLQRRLHDELPDHVRLFVMYGQTEASPRLSWVPPERLAHKFGSIGVAIPGVSLTVRRPDGGECDTDEVGEVVADGENIMEGYWNAPEETATVLRPDGLHTGDLGRRDADGFIWLVDRIKNMIKVGANRVSPKEIEEVIAELPAVQEACVVGVPDELLGEAIEVHVVPRPGDDLQPEAVQRHCRERLPLYKIPRAVHLTAELPRNSAGKVLRDRLRDPS